MKKALVAAFLIVTAIPLIIGVASMPPHGDPDAPAHTRIAVRYLAHGEQEAGAPNIVTDVILNYRGLDTSGEVTVIFTALAATLAVLLTGAPLFMRVPGELTQPALPADAVPVSPVVGFVIRLVTPFSAMFAGYVLLHGHSSPGGGFQAGSVLGGIFIVLTIIVGREHTLTLLPRRIAPLLQGAALICFMAVGILGAVLTGYFLGFPALSAHALTELMITVIEVGIGIGGAAIFATIFLQMEAE